MSGNLPGDVHHLLHAEALPISKIVDQRSGIRLLLSKRLERQQMGLRQIADVDVIPYAGAIRSWIIAAENLNVIGSAERDLKNPRNQMCLGIVSLSFIGTAGTGGIEIPQAGIAQSVNLMKPGQHA